MGSVEILTIVIIEIICGNHDPIISILSLNYILYNLQHGHISASKMIIVMLIHHWHLLCDIVFDALGVRNGLLYTVSFRNKS